jgi:hypothetical protein
VNKFYNIIIILFFTQNLTGQEIETSQIEKLLTRDYTLGLNLNTAGWGFAFNYSIQKTYKYKQTFGLTVGNIRHPKEYKIQGTLGSKGFYYGKLYSLVSVRPSYGGKKKLFKAERENGVEITYNWAVGPSFGILKPVYLEINKIENGTLAHYPERYDPEKHFAGQIYSRSSWGKGLGESRVLVGAFLKNGIEFNFSNYRTGISGGELGFMVDYYPLNKIELVYQQGNNNLFASLYLQLNIGKKY